MLRVLALDTVNLCKVCEVMHISIFVCLSIVIILQYMYTMASYCQAVRLVRDRPRSRKDSVVNQSMKGKLGNTSITNYRTGHASLQSHSCESLTTCRPRPSHRSRASRYFWRSATSPQPVHLWKAQLLEANL